MKSLTETGYGKSAKGLPPISEPLLLNRCAFGSWFKEATRIQYSDQSLGSG